MRIGLIYARSRNCVIGRNGVMPWHLPEDLLHFKAKTMGCPVIMGRKTWDSIPPSFRPLRGRRNIVITRQDDWQAQGAERAASLEDALAMCADAPQVWITGGAEIYRQALDIADIAEVTVVEGLYDGDAFAPKLGPHWREVAREDHVSRTDLRYCHITYVNTLKSGD